MRTVIIFRGAGNSPSPGQTVVGGVLGLRKLETRGGIMALSNTTSDDDLHPIDIVENLASHHDWDFDRIADDQIDGGRRCTHSLTAWSDYDETRACALRWNARGKVPQLYELIT